METLTTHQAYVKMLNTEGRIFTVWFIKKDNSLREMNCRLGVKKNVKGVGMSYNPTSKGLINVFDMQKKEYRMIVVDNIKRLKIDGKQYLVGDGKFHSSTSIEKQIKVKEETYLTMTEEDLEQTISNVYGYRDFSFIEDIEYSEMDSDKVYKVTGKLSREDHAKILAMDERTFCTNAILNDLCQNGFIQAGTYRIIDES